MQSFELMFVSSNSGCSHVPPQVSRDTHYIQLTEVFSPTPAYSSVILYLLSKLTYPKIPCTDYFFLKNIFGFCILWLIYFITGIFYLLTLFSLISWLLPLEITNLFSKSMIFFCLFFIFCVRSYVICLWLISFSIKPWRTIHIVTNCKILLFLWQNNISIWMQSSKE